ncbi:unnamed protein product [Dovyalis caffra]|uniref:Cytochrome P450 n=1 Tax=Dovyalis caffra TaxID=77055 RepID=A0AAV1RUF3_9ROSI|nr:unnamed protein product [Dovyalis caffra]
MNQSPDEFVASYVDALLDMQLPDEKRKVEEGERVSARSLLMQARTNTSTTLQWIMANLVKYPHIQEKLFEEIQGVVDAGEEEIKEDLLKAVILEELRRHPPGHFVVPKNGSVNFMVAEIGWDAKVWEDPMMFKPERFLNDNNTNGIEVFDVTGSREVKMMPFGVGMRIYPWYRLAMLHLEYFVANLVWDFKWTTVDKDDVDLSEKQEFTVTMKNPLEAHRTPTEKARDS